MLRSRWFSVVAVAVAIAAAFTTLLLHGDRIAETVFRVAILLCLCSAVFLYGRTMDVSLFRKPSTELGWFIPSALLTTSIPYFGVYSPASVGLVVAIYFTGLGKTRWLSRAVYATSAVVTTTIGVIVIVTGTDIGIVRGSELPVIDQVLVLALLEIMLAVTLIIARLSRRTTLAVVEELERAVRLATRRQALLLEARDDLERALRQGRSRFTGQELAGHVLGELLGRGAMGEVYAADGPRGPVAIKLLSQASLTNPDLVARFLRELRTAAMLQAPNIVAVIEIGEQPIPYMVMERLEGKTLSELLRGGRLSMAQIVDLVRQIGAGITVAAAAGIVHRDLKPQNVFLHGTVWKVLDFGIARALDAGETLTAGNIVGTPVYMSPEQASGARVDPSTDLYALAAIAYRAITDQPPFPPGEVAETLYKVVNTRPRRPTDLADVPPEIDLVLAIGMAKDPRQRFGTAKELADALAAAFAGALPANLYHRGRTLELSGAWAGSSMLRATARMHAVR